jgi:Predicted membrane protein
MDWWRMFGSTFVLIFLAELGDKTQLAAMARVADGPDGSSAKWAVFLAASAALVLSTLIAVFFGGVLRALIPDERYIKIAAGLLFVIFGVVILGGVARSYLAPEAEVQEQVSLSPEETEEPGYIGSLILKAALDFEKSAGERYRTLAGQAADPELGKLMQHLADEEESHYDRLANIGEKADKAFSRDTVVATQGVQASPSASQALSNSLLANLLRHEKATADFYASLAGATVIPSLKPVFQRLAEEELSHVRHLGEALRQKRT